MAAAVARALAESRSLLVEAGTGTGKTLAYLIPALLSGRRVVVSTGTRALQDQITSHDVPLLREILPVGFEAVALKGVSNYVCRRKLAELRAGATRTGNRPGPVTENLSAETVADIAEWSEHTDIGDRAEVSALAEDAPAWRSLTQTPETRLGSGCPFHETCFVTRARRRAEQAALVLVNHHLFFADLALRASHPGARVLPDYDAVVFDEAHQLEGVMTRYFGIRVSTAGVARLCQDARFALVGAADLLVPRPPGHEMSARIVESVERCGARLFEVVGRHLATVRVENSERVAVSADLFADGERQDAWFQLDSALDELSAQARSAARARVGDDDPERAETAQAVARRAALMREELAALAEQSATSSFVYWGEARGHSVSLCGAPIHVGDYLREHLLAGVQAAVFTSATLTAGHAFDYVRERLGLDLELADELAIDSPFDYTRQAILYIPRDLPDPREPGFAARACARIGELVELTEGRAFVLFTSHRALRDMAGRLARDIASKNDFRLLVQGQMPKNKLLSTFRTTPRCVLLGTGTFWEGVDVPGDALSLVIIDKLPFAPPTDPLMAARIRQYERDERDPFTELQVPRAALALTQGIGRLIRRADDRGIMAVLDHRLLARRYGQIFLDSLPPGLRRTSSFEQVRRFFVDAAADG